MELEITDLFKTLAPRDYAASVAEIGDDAGAVTWQAAREDAPLYLITDQSRDALRAHFADYGAWSDEDIAAWSDRDLAALLLQFIAGDFREAFPHRRTGDSVTAADWLNLEAMADNGQVSGRLFGGPLSVDGRIYYYVGS